MLRRAFSPHSASTVCGIVCKENTVYTAVAVYMVKISASSYPGRTSIDFSIDLAAHIIQTFDFVRAQCSIVHADVACPVAPPSADGIGVDEAR